MATIDGLIATLGNPGKLQCCLALLVTLSMTLVSMHHLSMVFMGATPPHHCKVTDEFSLNDTIPTVLKEGRVVLDQCHMYIDPTNHSLGQQECTNGWSYLYERGEWSVVGEFNLVCNSRYLVGLVSTIYFSGTIAGSVVFGHLADRVGRKPVFLTTLYAQAFMGVVQYFTDSYQMFVVFKFLHGMLIQGLYASLLCLVMEMFHTAWRTEASIFMNLMYTTGQFVLVFLAYFNPHWKHFYLASTLPSLMAIVYICLVPESLRWLLVNKYKTEALLVAQKFVKFNKINLEVNLAEEIDHVTEKKAEHNKHDVRDLFRTHYIRRTSLLVVYLWFSMAFVYFGINFSLPSLHGDKYLNFAISVCVEFVCRCLTYPGLKLIGRRMTGSLCFLLTGITCIASTVVSTYLEGDSANSIATGLAIFARAAGSCTFVCVMLQTQESFPTILRSSALGFGGVFNRIGSMAAPQIVLLGVYTYPMVPFVVLGAVGITAAFVSLLMPETFNTVLPDTLEQAEKLNSKQKAKKIRSFDLSSYGSSVALTDQDPNFQNGVYLCDLKDLNSPVGKTTRTGEAKMDHILGKPPSGCTNNDAPSSPPAILILAESLSRNLMKDLRQNSSFQQQRSSIASTKTTTSDVSGH